jgi:hypothetical protein
MQGTFLNGVEYRRTKRTGKLGLVQKNKTFCPYPQETFGIYFALGI